MNYSSEVVIIWQANSAAYKPKPRLFHKFVLSSIEFTHSVVVATTHHSRTNDLTMSKALSRAIK